MDELEKNVNSAGRKFGWATVLGIVVIAFVIWLSYLASHSTPLARDLSPTVHVKDR